MRVVAAVVVVVSTDAATAAAAAVCVLQHRLDGKWKFVLEKGRVREAELSQDETLLKVDKKYGSMKVLNDKCYYVCMYALSGINKLPFKVFELSL